ncbi:aldose epimerase family protein [Spongiimicrobium salis]|uniref:aldose epimerase family protein n=1 Tax=Spongiimicrobium salis TaxID=1667022 RepID=UPI00374D27DC
MNQVTIKNDHISLTVLDYGAIIQKMQIKTPQGTYIEGVLGYEDPENYLIDPFFLGACVGRYAGRISDGGFTLNGKKYPLSTENDVHLHGGKSGFSKKFWTIDQVEQGPTPYISLSYLSAHLEEGYPGNLKVKITYKLVRNELHIIQEAYTDETTVVNLTNHSYFSLDPHPAIAHYQMKLESSHILETDDRLLPTGKQIPVNDSQYDFRQERKIGNTRLDTPFVLDKVQKETISVASQKSGLSMQIKTNQPAVIVYTPNKLPGICFETQNFPDAPNNASFPSSVLHPGETYNNTSIFKFGFIH